MTTLRIYVGATVVVALLTAGAVFGGPVDGPGITLTAPVIALSTAAVLAGFFPLVILRRDGNEDVETTHAFLLAVLLIAGPATAVAAQAVTVLVVTVGRRRPFIKSVFNVAQMTASAAAASAVLAALVAVPVLGDGSGLTVGETAAFMAAALVYQLVNDLAVIAVCALAEGRSFVRFMTQEFRMTWFTAAVSATAPLAAAGALVGFWLVPVLVAPLWAFRHSMKLAQANFEQARCDALTGLPNAVALREALDEAVDHRGTAVTMVDLDGFKDVNDALSHQTGDILLRAVAERLSACTASSGQVFRLQGDEFVTLLDSACPHDALVYAEGLAQAFQEPFLAGGLDLEVGLSAGVAVAARGECTTDELLRRTDVAMYEAKRNRTGAALYEPSADGGEEVRQVILADLRRALTAGDLEVHYQPQVSLRTGAVMSLEALVRLRRADGTLVPPDAFISQAEHSGLILPLTLHVLGTALADCRRWIDELGYQGRVGVNLSARTLHYRSLVSDVGQALADAGVDPGRLELEITESGLMSDPAGAHRTLSALHALGVDILIDDFGTGYSSLAYLGRLPVDGVKIDRSFVAGMTDSHTDAVIVRSTIDLGHNLGLRVVAEGVEDEATRACLAGLECDVGQGWLWSKAVPAAEVSRLFGLVDSVPFAA